MFSDLLFYGQSTGVAKFFRTENGSITLLRQEDGWRHDLTHILPCRFLDVGLGDLFFYASSNGTVELWNLRATADGRGQKINAAQLPNWAEKQWDLIVPGNFLTNSINAGIPTDAVNDLLFYDSATGTGEFYSIGPSYLTVRRRHPAWPQGWSHIVPGKFGGSDYTDLLFYNQTSGVAEFHTVHDGVISLLRRTQWQPGWTFIIPGDFGGGAQTDLLFYRAADGNAKFYATNDSKMTMLREETKWRKTWTKIVPGQFGGSGRTDLFFYEGSTGASKFYSTNGGAMTLLREHTFQTTWSQIIAFPFGTPAPTPDGGGTGGGTPAPNITVTTVTPPLTPYKRLLIRGTGFLPGETVNVMVTTRPTGQDPWSDLTTTTANSIGHINFQALDNVCPGDVTRHYTVQGSGATSSRVSNVGNCLPFPHDFARRAFPAQRVACRFDGRAYAEF